MIGGDGERPLVDAQGPLNQGHLRQANAWTVLSAVRNGGVTSRSRLTEETGLTAMTVHRIVVDLRHRRLLLPAGRSTSGGVGRPSSLFSFNAGIAHVAAIDVGNETTRVVLADLAGTTHGRVERATAAIESELDVELARIVRELAATSEVPLDTLVGVGVGVPAITDASGTIVRASLHHVWEGLALGGHLRSALGCDVLVTQDDHLAALAELRKGSCVGARSALVLDVGKGIGAGIVADGEVYAGARAAAGRVGWIPLATPDAEPPVAARRLTGDGLATLFARRRGEPAPAGALAVFEADAAGDPDARAVVDEFADELGWLIGALVAVLDPEVVVVGGGISGSFERLRPAVERRVASIVPTPPAVVPSRLVPEAVVLGAIEAALELSDGWLRAVIGD